jgi:mRNA interferase MazF
MTPRSIGNWSRRSATVLSSRPLAYRGEVWLVGLDPAIGSEQAKTRPCIVIQRDVANRLSRTTVIVPLTDATKHAPSIVSPLCRKGDGGLKNDSVALCAQIRAVDRLRMRTRLGALSGDSMRAVCDGLRIILDLDEA